MLYEAHLIAVQLKPILITIFTLGSIAGIAIIIKHG